MLNTSDYSRFLDSLNISAFGTVTGNGRSPYVNLNMSSPFPMNSFEQRNRQQLENMEICHLLKMKNNEIVDLAKTSQSSKLLQQHIQESSEVRQKFYALFNDEKYGTSLLTRLASDGCGNFVIQKLLTSDVLAAAPLIGALEQIAPNLALNRFGCRVVQRLVQVLSPERVRLLLIHRFKGIELQLVTDQNGNHVIQYIVAHFKPDIYIDFMSSLIVSVGLRQVIENKYGCRVIQAILEQTVNICKTNQNQLSNEAQPKLGPGQKQEMDSSLTRGINLQNQPKNNAAFELLKLVIDPILRDARHMSEQEYGNYIVQTVLKNSFLHNQSRYIIKEHFMDNLLVMSQNKFASHVLEVAFRNADGLVLDAMFSEILEGYYKHDKSGKSALHIVLFDEFGNYVLQRMLDIAFQVRLGRREGNPQWFNNIVTYAHRVERRLGQYSSGKKILDTIHSMESKLAQPLFSTRPPQVAFRKVHSPPQKFFPRQFNNHVQPLFAPAHSLSIY